MSARASGDEGTAGGPAPVKALARGLDILSQFTARDPSLSLAELGRRTGLNPATVYRFVKTLQHKGYLAQDPNTGHYRVGPAFAVTLLSIGGSSVLVHILEHDLAQLARATGEGASLALRSGDQLLAVNVVPPSAGLAQVVPSNSARPLTDTWSAQVRIHLAFADEETRARALAAPAVKYTERTVTDPRKLKALLTKVAQERIAYSREERVHGRAAVAVPVFSEGRLVAALALHIPPDRFDETHLERYVRDLRASAAAMEERLQADTPTSRSGV